MTYKMSVKRHVKISAFNVLRTILLSLKSIATVKKYHVIEIKKSWDFTATIFVIWI